MFGLLGPNGAGKSTTVGILTTRVRPTAGQAWIGAHDVWNEQVATKRLIGVVAQRPNLDFSLTAREILLYHGGYFGLDSAQRTKRADELLDRFKLQDRANQMVRGFSGGMMQRLSIARAMMHDPQVLFLDEPSAGLDPQTRLLLWEIIREYNQSGKTILLTTHNMDEADALCHRLAIIDHGRNIALGTPGELKASVPGGYLLQLRFDRNTPELLGRASVALGRAGGPGERVDRGGSLRRSWRLANPGDRRPGRASQRRPAGCSHRRTQPRKSVPAPHRKEVARLNWKCFFAMLARDAHVARRNIFPLLLQTFLQPLIFVFIFGRVMVRSGYMPEAYKSLLLPGIMAISMVFTGIWAVAMPLIAEFQFTREIEDRLLAPMEIHWVAIEKVFAGTLQALAAGLFVIPMAWLMLGPGVGFSMHHPLTFACVTLLVALFSACGGLALGCSVNQQQIGLMFSMVLTPMIFFGCTYYPVERPERTSPSCKRQS